MAEFNKQTWDSCILSRDGSFLQSWAWGQFQKAAGEKVLFLKDNDWQSVIIVSPLAFGKTYFYAPYGPIWNKEKNDDKNIFENFLGKVKLIARKHNAIFLKIEPKTPNPKIADIVQSLGFKKAEKSIQPENTIIVDLTKSEDEILTGMEKRCRYEIKQAEKKRVSFFCDNSREGTKNFLKLLEKTAERDAFRTHPLSYYQKLIETLKSADQTDLFFAKIGQDIISACIIIYFGATASYVHAASSGPYRAANALVWTAMREAKKKLCSYFDLYGVAPLDAGEHHPWRGLTKFKENFGGKRVNYIGAYDYPFLNFWFNLYKFGKKFLVNNKFLK